MMQRYSLVSQQKLNPVPAWGCELLTGAGHVLQSPYKNTHRG